MGQGKPVVWNAQRPDLAELGYLGLSVVSLTHFRVRSIMRQTDPKSGCGIPDESRRKQNRPGKPTSAAMAACRRKGRYCDETIGDVAPKQAELDIGSQVQSLSYPPLSQ
jgi:hypothetical protein